MKTDGPNGRLLVYRPEGLYCPAGDFYIDPWRAVPRAVITHAHSDHAVRGCEAYLTSTPGAGVLRVRLGEGARIESAAYGSRVRLGGATVSLHPAGHVLGSSQVRVETAEGSAVASGDYALARHPACEPFEPVECDEFITESTFGLPIYAWPEASRVMGEILSWWRDAAESRRTAVLLAYSLGKAQRLLSLLPADAGPIGVHGALLAMNRVYLSQGVALAPHVHATAETARELRGRGLIIAPPAAAASPWIRRFAPVTTAMASGWMLVRGSRRRRSLDRGFVLSDHADWRGLLRAIELSRAARVTVAHGYTRALSRLLQERGLDASEAPPRAAVRGEEDAGLSGEEV